MTFPNYIGPNTGKRLAGIYKEACQLTNFNGQAVSWSFCDANGTTKGAVDLSSGQNIYIKVAKSQLNGNGSQINLTIYARKINAVAEWWTMKCNDEDQRRLYIVYASREWVPYSTTVTLNVGNLNLLKIDKGTRQGIDRMQFKIRNSAGYWLTSYSSTGLAVFGTTNEAQAMIVETSGGGRLSIPKVDFDTYTIKEVGVGPNWQYEAKNQTWTVTSSRSNLTGSATMENEKTFIKITGYVWVDRGSDGKETSRNNLYNSGTNDRYLNNVDIRLKHKTNANFNNEGRAITATSSVRIDPDTRQYISYQFVVRRGELPNLYIEFDYDGLQYQCVTPNGAINGSKASETTSARDTFNANFSTIEGNGNNTGYTLNSSGARSQSLSYTKQNHNSILNNVKTTENSSTVTITNKGNYHIKSDTKTANYQLVNPGAGIDIIQNVNFGVYERTQPDLAIIKDIQSLKLSVNGRTHVYSYNQRIQSANNTNTSGFNVGVKFQNSYKTNYKRPIYRSDFEYTSSDKSKELQVYITYRIAIRNQSSLIATEPNRIYEYYDKRYELVNVGKGLNGDGSTVTNALGTGQYRRDTSYNNGNYTKLIIEPNLGTINAGQEKSLYVQFHLQKQAVLDILNGKENLDNFIEIASYSSVRNGKPYAGVDIDSNPGNAKPTDAQTVEDDTDVSPTLLLEVANAREMQGTVFVDEATGANRLNVMTGQVRQGDGKYVSGESTLGGVGITFREQGKENKGLTYKTETVDNTGTYKFKVEYYNSNGQKIEERYERLYYNNSTKQPTSTNGTDFDGSLPEGTEIRITPELANGTEISNGIYTKQLHKGEFFLVGYVPGDYTLTYTWGGQEYQLNGKNEKVTVQNYKGTIYDYNRYLRNYVGTNGNSPDKNWYKTDKERYSDAIDDYDTRLKIDENFKTIDSTTDRGEKYTNSGKYITTMDSTTPVMSIDVEYNIGGTKKPTTNSTEITDRYSNNVPNIDFGVIRRAKQDYIIEKKISAVKISLANGRTLADLKVNAQGQIEGAKIGATYMPGSPSTIPTNGFLRFEMDSELMQGASVELTYGLAITNISEVDYVDENFYKFGTIPRNNANIVTIQPTKIADYLDQEWSFQNNKNKVGSESTWKIVKTDENEIGIEHGAGVKYTLTQQTLESDSIDKKQVQILYSDYAVGKNEWKLDPLTNKSQKIDLNVSKLLSSSQDIELDNEVEIVQIVKNGGGDIEETINPGNYQPGLEEEYRVGLHEHDDSKAETFTVTPNTGENRNYTPLIITILTTFAILIGGIIFIKKKVLNK